MIFYHNFAVKNESWISPSNWTAGDQPALYRSFDGDDDLGLMNGASIVPGQVEVYIITFSGGHGKRTNIETL